MAGTLSCQERPTDLNAPLPPESPSFRTWVEWLQSGTETVSEDC